MGSCLQALIYFIGLAGELVVAGAKNLKKRNLSVKVFMPVKGLSILSPYPHGRPYSSS